MADNSTPGQTLTSVARGDLPVIEQLFAMNLDALERSELDEETYHLVRFATLVAMDAGPVSYMINLGVAINSGVSLDRLQSVLIAIAPVVGSARVASAAGKMLRAYGLAEAIEEDDA